MKGSGSKGKRKGGAYERKACRTLSLLISNGTQDDWLWRSAGSGSRATRRKQLGKTSQYQSGDVSSVAPESAWLVRDWYIELKFYRDVQLAGSLLNGSGRLQRFWQKTQQEAQHHHKKPFLLVKQNRLPEIVLVSQGALPQQPLFTWHQQNADVHLFNAIKSLTGTAPIQRKRVLLAE